MSVQVHRAFHSPVCAAPRYHGSVIASPKVPNTRETLHSSFAGANPAEGNGAQR